jgi:hypothetical protein
VNSQAAAPPIVLVHGLWLTPRSWEGWRERFESRGHQVLAPAWPRMPGEVEEVRRDPSALNGLGITEVVDHYEGIVRGLERPPVIMGPLLRWACHGAAARPRSRSRRCGHLSRPGQGRAAPAPG